MCESLFLVWDFFQVIMCVDLYIYFLIVVHSIVVGFAYFLR